MPCTTHIETDYLPFTATPSSV